MYESGECWNKSGEEEEGGGEGGGKLAGYAGKVKEGSIRCGFCGRGSRGGRVRVTLVDVVEEALLVVEKAEEEEFVVEEVLLVVEKAEEEFVVEENGGLVVVVE
ncbi:hypothetical protein Pcinc_034197 [Petrolisthes cinctipes]|uniref:Uncharacterized protein n=1 Tax=Petrolisthes cinctipes TaxID=88211 RepID=A0AAE1EQS6_PETCI|nr:hypothetical protein Pcinc_034197 [Petrolisthes cinctipes]